MSILTRGKLITKPVIEMTIHFTSGIYRDRIRKEFSLREAEYFIGSSSEEQKAMITNWRSGRVGSISNISYSEMVWREGSLEYELLIGEV